MKAKYDLIVTRGGSSSTMPAATLKDIYQDIAYLLSEKQPGESINVIIVKNK